MGAWHVVSSLVIAAAALYGLGIPLAWLLPAPANAAWVYRIAIGPVFAIALTSPISWVLYYAGVPFQPWMLALLAAAAWYLAWSRNRETWPPSSGWGGWGWPSLMVGASAYLWWLSLLGRGLYLPNRDFKNHAYSVAQFAMDRAVDPINTYTAGTLASADVSGLGRVGLHTLIAWALPSTEWNSLGVTAAAVVVTTAVSIPLGMITLARIWRPGSALLWKHAGMGGVVVPAFTGPFSIGSVSLLFGAAMFPAALAALWQLVLRPNGARLAGVILVGAGMAFAHIPEAAALGILFLLAIPSVVWGMTHGVDPRRRIAMIAGVAACLLIPAAVMFLTFPYLSEQRRDIQANDDPLWAGLLYPWVAYPGGSTLLRLVAFGLLLLGAWMAVRERLRLEPLLVLAVLSVISLGASWSAAPEFLRALATPWYGTAGRVSLLAGGPALLLMCLPLSSAASALAAVSSKAARTALMGAAALAAAFSCAAFATGMVDGRRYSSAAALAGAGDTPAIAAELKGLLGPGASVLNLEIDGSANLFAAARVPIVTGLSVMQTLPGGGPAGELLTDHWLDLTNPEVADALDDLRVGYFALGSTNVYWGADVGYVAEDLADQEQLTPVLTGSDVVIYRYDPEERAS